MEYSRRDFTRIGLAGLALSGSALRSLAAVNKSYFHGVQLGVQTYCFHDIPVDGMNHADWVIKDMLVCQVYDCELYSPQIEPGGQAARAALVMQEWAGSRPTGTVTHLADPEEARKARAEQTKWRATVPLDFWRNIGKQFNDAGINIYAHCITFYPDAPDEEMDRCFQFAKALGAKLIDTSTSYSLLKRLVPFAEKHNMVIAVHGHAGVKDSDQFSTRETFEKAFKLSNLVWANLDIGHYWAAGGDPVEFIEAHHDRISNLHIKDRVGHHGPAGTFWRR